MFQGIQKALMLAPHPDDGEFSSGGTLKKLIEEGVEVFYVAFSPCTKSVPEGFDKDVLYTELKAALSKLGIAEDHIITFNYDVREFPKFRQEILEDLIGIRKMVKPDLVLMPNSDDIHQDHHTIYQEGLRAFKTSRLLGYELPWNNLNFKSNFHVKLEKHHIEAKIDSIGEYKSQGFRTYHDDEFFLGLAKVRGVQVGAAYAEAFEVIRWWL